MANQNRNTYAQRVMSRVAEKADIEANLTSLGHAKVLAMTCQIAKKNDQKSIQQWKSLLENLPYSLLDELNKDFSHFSVTARNPYLNRKRLGHRANKVPLSSTLVSTLRKLEDHEIYNMYSMLNDESMATTVGIPVKNVEFSQKMAAHLISTNGKTSVPGIKELYITYDWISKDDLPNILKNTKDTLKTLRVFTSPKTEAQVLQIVTKSGCQLEEMQFMDREKEALVLETKDLVAFLQSQAKSLKKLDLGFWLESKSSNDLDQIFQQIPNMRALEWISVFMPHLVKDDNDNKRFERFQYFNRKGLTLQLDVRGVSLLLDYLFSYFIRLILGLLTHFRSD